jgi:hypothetical protein
VLVSFDYGVMEDIGPELLMCVKSGDIKEVEKYLSQHNAHLPLLSIIDEKGILN